MFKLHIETGDDDPEERNAELARILRRLATDLSQRAAEQDAGSLLDTNGNRVGVWFVQ